MKFNKRLPPEVEEFLTAPYKDYIKETPMTKKEMRVLREWVKDGHSVYENTSNAWADGQVPVEFLTVYRVVEYIRQHTKGMSPEETRKFAMDYYGWSDDEPVQQPDGGILYSVALSPDEELPFQ